MCEVVRPSRRDPRGRVVGFPLADASVGRMYGFCQAHVALVGAFRCVEPSLLSFRPPLVMLSSQRLHRLYHLDEEGARRLNINRQKYTARVLLWGARRLQLTSMLCFCAQAKAEQPSDNLRHHADLREVRPSLSVLILSTDEVLRIRCLTA